MTSFDEETHRRRALVMGAFSPTRPITDKTLFAGRRDKMENLIKVVSQRGQHAVIYGERGVGKTSLARVMKLVLDGACWTSDYTCSSTDTFGSIWREILASFQFSEKRPAPGFNLPEKASSTTSSLASMLGEGEPSPNQIRRCLEILDDVDPAVIFIDEFDRPVDQRLRTLFADTIKILSDQGINVTLVLVGVGDTVEELIAEHASVQRALVQIQMPRMGSDELVEIVHQGMRTARLKASDDFTKRVVELSQGLPHYTHLISQHAGICAVDDGCREVVEPQDFDCAVSAALRDVSQTVRECYHNATYSNRDTLYKQVLLACAMTSKDDLGTFGAPDVRDQLPAITGRNYEIPSFASHLNAFSSEGSQRGGILIRKGTQGRFRYRFVDPLLPPYIVMKGKVDGLIS